MPLIRCAHNMKDILRDKDFGEEGFIVHIQDGLVMKKVRVLINNDKGIWSAMSLDLGLSAQGDSYEQVISKMRNQIDDYIHEAYTIDKNHKKDLLSRKGPLEWFIRYYFTKVFFISNNFSTYVFENVSIHNRAIRYNIR